MARAFPLYRQWGIEGVMLDFMDRDDQEMVKFLREVLKTAAANHLTVTLHGVSKPTGLERTYPNLLTSEAVMNLEYDKWDPLGIPPEHELTVPFTRMLAGPLDFHQGSLPDRAGPGFPAAERGPAGHGDALPDAGLLRRVPEPPSDGGRLSLGLPRPSGAAVLAGIPTTWDDTRFLSGAVGEWVVIARRNGKEWWVGAMTNQASPGHHHSPCVSRGRTVPG